jgi:hypothetical protein
MNIDDHHRLWYKWQVLKKPGIDSALGIDKWQMMIDILFPVILIKIFKWLDRNKMEGISIIDKFL